MNNEVELGEPKENFSLGGYKKRGDNVVEKVARVPLL